MSWVGFDLTTYYHLIVFTFFAVIADVPRAIDCTSVPSVKLLNNFTATALRINQWIVGQGYKADLVPFVAAYLDVVSDGTDFLDTENYPKKKQQYMDTMYFSMDSEETSIFLSDEVPWPHSRNRLFPTPDPSCHFFQQSSGRPDGPCGP